MMVRFDPEMIDPIISDRPQPVHAACHQPGPSPHDRRRPHGVRVGGERTQRGRSRRWATHRQPARLSEPAAAGAVAELDPLHARLPGRAGRHPRIGATPRGHARPADADRQGDPRVLAGTSTQSRRDRDGADRTRRHRRPDRRRTEPRHDHQHQLAAHARRADEPRHHRDVAPQPGGVCHAVHTRRRNGTDHARRSALAAERRGSGRV